MRGLELVKTAKTQKSHMRNSASQLSHVPPEVLNTVHTRLRPIPLWLRRSHLAVVRSSFLHCDDATAENLEKLEMSFLRRLHVCNVGRVVVRLQTLVKPKFVVGSIGLRRVTYTAVLF